MSGSGFLPVHSLPFVDARASCARSSLRLPMPPGMRYAGGRRYPPIRMPFDSPAESMTSPIRYASSAVVMLPGGEFIPVYQLRTVLLYAADGSTGRCAIFRRRAAAGVWQRTLTTL